MQYKVDLRVTATEPVNVSLTPTLDMGWPGVTPAAISTD